MKPTQDIPQDARLCHFPQCGRERKGPEWCRAHRDQKRKGRGMTPIRPRGDSLESKFWRWTEKGDGCWEWTGTKKSLGYGRFRHFNKAYLAHRVSYEIHYGAIPEGMVIDHLCHNSSCVKPEHLRAVTQEWNMQNQIRPSASNKSGVRGVYWDRRKGAWIAASSLNGVPAYIGSFRDLDEAERAITAWRETNHPGYLGNHSISTLEES